MCLLVVLYLMFGAFVFLALNEDLWDPHVIPVVPGMNGEHGASRRARVQSPAGACSIGAVAAHGA